MRYRAHYWLAILLMQGCLWGALLNGLELLPPQRQPDTASYEQTPWSSLTDLMGHMRTPGYGAFLDVVHRCGLSDATIPLVQYAVYVCAVCLFWWGLTQWSGMPVLGCAAASMLLYGNIAIRFGGSLTPDLLAAAAGVASIGLLLGSHSARLNWWRMVLTGLLITVAWMLRPVYLFLIPLLPLLDLALISLQPDTPRSQSNWLRVAKLTSCGLGPLALWCGMRFAIVGDATPVAFGGNHMLALACNFATEADTPQLTPELQPLWKDVLRHRHELAAATRERRPLADWFVDHPAELLRDAEDIRYSAEPSGHYSLIESRFVLDVWGVCTPVTKNHVGDDWLAADRTMRQLGNELIHQHRQDYVRYYFKAVVRGCLLSLTEQLRNWPQMLVLGALGLLIWRQARLPGQNKPAVLLIPMAWLQMIVGLGTIACVFALLKVLAIAVTTPPIGRMTDPAGMFWGAMPACLLAMLLCRRCGGEFANR